MDTDDLIALIIASSVRYSCWLNLYFHSVADFLIGDALADGRLERLLPDWDVAPIGIYAVYTSRNHLAPKVRSFIDYLVEALG